MAQSHYHNDSRLPSYNNGQSAILKGTPEGRESSPEESVQFPHFYQRRGSVVCDIFGNEICSQFPPGETPPILDDEEIKVMYSEI